MCKPETDRGHVPFALLGVLVLVASIALASSVHQPTASEVSVDREMERVTAETQTALREATLAATHEGARNPVVEPAGTPAGDVLREGQVFEDALRLRIYVQARERLDALKAQRGALTVSASVPEIRTQAELREARDRVELAATGEHGEKLRVQVADVMLTVERDGHQVAQQTVEPEITVHSPVLAAHERVETFEGRLHGGMLEDGLGEKLTARLYPVAWARGYAQYSGAPIEQVIANRHVGLITNGALLDLQTETFGDSDPVGRETLRRTTAEVGITDFLGGSNRSAAEHLLDAREEAGSEQQPAASLAAIEPDTTHPSPDDEVTHGINETAESAFLGFLSPDTWTHPATNPFAEHQIEQQARQAGVIPLEETIQQTYTERVKLDAKVTEGERNRQTVGNPEPDWEHVDTTTETELRVVDREGLAPELPDGWHRHEHYPREVEHVERTTLRWLVGNETRTTKRIETTTFAVDISLIGQFAGPAPARPIETVHEHGGPFDGPNMADVAEDARDLLVDRRGGPDTLAQQAVRGTLDTEPVQLQGEYPSEIRNWSYPDVAEIRTEIENITTTTTRGEVATYEENVPRALHGKLQDRRDSLVDVPETYGNVSHRARVGARAAYVDRVAFRLALRAEQHEDDRDTLADELADRFGVAVDDPFERLQEGIALEPSRASPPETPITMRVDTDPSYLPRDGVDDEVMPTLSADEREYPLVVRNVNAVAAPYGDIADALVGLLSGTERTDIQPAASVLKTTESAKVEGIVSTADERPDPIGTNPVEEAYPEPYVRLNASVTAGLEHMKDEITTVLSEHDLGDEHSRNAVVEDALAQWETTPDRAIALTNGSGEEAIVDATLDRWGGKLSGNQQDLLAVQLGAVIRQARADSDARPAVAHVEGLESETTNKLEDVAADQLEAGLENATEETVEHVTGRTLSSFPKGVPVLPPPFFWMMTGNYWSVQVQGEYPRFAVRVPQSSPDRPGADLVYVRDGSSVRLDVTGDGTAELLGTADRVQFAATTHVVVAVPPGPRGVGDVDGQMSEESAGWPTPGPRQQ